MTKGLTLKKVTIKDMRFMLNLYNYASLNGYFINKKKITYSDHKIWFLKNYKSNTTKILICFLNKIKIGYIKLDIFNKSSLIISIVVKNKYQNRNIGSFMLQKMTKIKSIRSNIKYLYAEVKKKNRNSIKFFLRHQFKKIKYSKKYPLVFKNNTQLYSKKI